MRSKLLLKVLEQLKLTYQLWFNIIHETSLETEILL